MVAPTLLEHSAGEGKGPAAVLRVDQRVHGVRRHPIAALGGVGHPEDAEHLRRPGHPPRCDVPLPASDLRQRLRLRELPDRELVIARFDTAEVLVHLGRQGLLAP